MYLIVRVIEAVDNVPAESEKLSPLYEETVEETEREQHLLVFGLCRAARESPLTHKVVQTLHVGLEALHVHVEKPYRAPTVFTTCNYRKIIDHTTKTTTTI